MGKYIDIGEYMRNANKINTNDNKINNIEKDKIEFTILSAEEIFGSEIGENTDKYHTQLDIFKDKDIAAKGTDLAKITGSEITEYVSYWTSLIDNIENIYIVNGEEDVEWAYKDDKTIAIRPAISCDNINEDITKYIAETDGYGREIVEYGYFPQWVVDDNTSNILESRKRNG